MVTSRGFLDVVDGTMEGKPVGCGAIDVVENSVVVCCTIPGVVIPRVVKRVTLGEFVVVGANIGVFVDVVAINSV